MNTRQYERLGKLVVRFQHGDEAAFQEFYQETAQVQYCRILRLIDNPSDADDLLQQVYLTFWQKAKQLDNPVAAIAYLDSVTRYTCLNHVRKCAREVPAEPKEVTEWKDDKPSNAPYAGMENREMQRELREAMDHLTNDEYTAVMLRYYQNRKVRDIAQMMYMSESTVKRLLRSALNRMQIHLKTYLPGVALTPAVLGTVLGPVFQGAGQAAPGLSAAPAVGSPVRTAAKASRKLVEKLFVSASAVTAAAVVGVSFTASVDIAELSAECQSPRNSPLPIAVSVSGMLPVADVYASCGEDVYPLYPAQGGGYEGSLPHNGTYMVTVEGNTGHTSSRSLEVSCIDTDPPELSDTRYRDGLSILVVEDATGVAEVSCTDVGGRKYGPESKDEERGEYAFRLPEGQYTFHFTDTVGNTVEGTGYLMPQNGAKEI
ncbi:MAG: sigma-70 family RNA polymerase sigma factor [Clostridiales bacterium]|nr:sigma-70 family RNA polymerase sigma factor [Clostridiales bacterium]